MRNHNIGVYPLNTAAIRLECKQYKREYLTPLPPFRYNYYIFVLKNLKRHFVVYKKFNLLGTWTTVIPSFVI